MQKSTSKFLLESYKYKNIVNKYDISFFSNDVCIGLLKVEKSRKYGREKMESDALHGHKKEVHYFKYL